MGKFFTPIILIVITVILYFTWISPTYGEVGQLKDKQAQLADALDKAQQVQTLIANLQASFSSVPQDQIARLTKMVPNDVDNIRLLIEINNIAQREGMTIDSLNIPPKPTAAPGTVGGSSGSYGTFTFGFTAHGTYDQFIAFLGQLAANLRLSDIATLSFSATDKGNYDYAITLNTYWIQ